MSGGEALHFEPASFRDRDARVLVRGDVVFRALGREGLAAWRALAGSTAFRTLVDEGRLIATDEVDPADAECPEPTLRAGLLRHQRVPFVSYPYEWSFSMLKDAALLHLDLIDRLLDDGLITKDATPYNVQWVGSSPVFVDVGSIRPLRPGEAWPGYRQFCRLFLYPLLLQARLGMPWQPWLRGAAEGIDAATCRKLLGTRAMLRPSLLAHVHLHAKVEARYAATDREVARELREAGFDSRFIRRNIHSLRRLIVSLAWEPERAGWAAYAPPEIYGSDDDGRKHAFVRDAVRARPRRHVWDLGANTGSYAAIAAPHAAGVVAFDSDEGVIELLYRQLRSRDDRVVVPLRVDLADPSPRGGWRQAEHRAIEDRGQPDLVLCLALLHHLVITAGVPLAAVVEWLASLGADLVVEFVTREDPMAQRLLRQRGGSCDDYDLRAFEDAVAARFARVANVSLAGGRRELFHLAHRRAVT